MFVSMCVNVTCEYEGKLTSPRNHIKPLLLQIIFANKLIQVSKFYQHNTKIDTINTTVTSNVFLLFILFFGIKLASSF